MRALLFLLSALILLETTGGVQYDSLEHHDRNIVDKAIKKANEAHGKDKHLDFSDILRPNPKTLNVILKPTSCNATPEKVHLKNCEIKDKAKPQFSCVACHGEISCFRLRETDKIKAAATACLLEHHLAGEAHALLIKDTKKTGCLGCI